MSAGRRRAPAGRPPGRRWGWHRLRTPWARAVVAGAGLRPGELVLDLGAGLGALTLPLARTGARVEAVELHPVRAAALRRAVADRGVAVREADMLRVRLPAGPFRVVASPPYALAAQLVRRLTSYPSRLVRADLVLPVALVQRWLARPPHGFVARRGDYLPRTAFDPPASADAAVLILERPQGRGAVSRPDKPKGADRGRPRVSSRPGTDNGSRDFR